MKDTVISCNLESSSTTDYFITNFFNKVKYLAKYGNSNFNNRDEWIEINDQEISSSDLTSLKYIGLEIYYSKLGKKDKEQYIINYAKYVADSRTNEIAYSKIL